jgi:hypothetical protein
MTPLPPWTEADWASPVGEPFRSDRRFWLSLAISADAVVALAVAVVVAALLGALDERRWVILPFAVPAVLTALAVVVSSGSSRRSRQAFPDAETWRDAERAAVATAFFHVLRRPRWVRHR